jgi:ferredoxin-type protein NapF
MNQSISRMQFLRGDLSGRNAPIRPPWALDEAAFTRLCNACGDCIERCPTKIIHSGRGSYPVIDFSAGECLFCGDCVDACKPGALKKPPKKTGSAPWSVKASIDTKACIAHRGVECRSCQDPCEVRAIEVPPRIGGVSVPVLDAGRCTGCAACFHVCPVSAVRMNMNPTQVSR